MRGLLLACLAASACTHSDRISVMAVSSVALVACDVKQTIAVSCGARWDCESPVNGLVAYESNPMLGRSPGIPRLMVSAIGVEAAVAWVAGTDKLPIWSKYVLLTALLVGEAYEISRMTPYVGLCGGGR
jgi:hypothetical protein